MAEKTTCPICGEPTRVYMGHARKDRLCGKHADELKAGKLEQCPDCNAWHSTDKVCKCKITTIPTAEWKREFEQNANLAYEQKIEEKNDEITCIICGAPSNGKHFCLKCYKQLKEFLKFFHFLGLIEQT